MDVQRLVAPAFTVVAASGVLALGLALGMDPETRQWEKPFAQQMAGHAAIALALGMYGWALNWCATHMDAFAMPTHRMKRLSAVVTGCVMLGGGALGLGSIAKKTSKRRLEDLSWLSGLHSEFSVTVIRPDSNKRCQKNSKQGHHRQRGPPPSVVPWSRHRARCARET